MSGIFSALGNLAGVLPVHIDETKVLPSLFDYTVKDLKAHEYPLAQHKGKVVLVVNVASKCGFTKQYKGLQELYSDLEPRGFVILGFPCNQFGEQEPGTNEDIESFCSRTYSVSFPIMDKVDVNGEQSSPVYMFLKKNSDQSNIVWNFTKFLVDKEGKVVKRYALGLTLVLVAHPRVPTAATAPATRPNRFARTLRPCFEASLSSLCTVALP